jgi:hypothetical protein
MACLMTPSMVDGVLVIAAVGVFTAAQLRRTPGRIAEQLEEAGPRAIVLDARCAFIAVPARHLSRPEFCISVDKPVAFVVPEWRRGQMEGHAWRMAIDRGCVRAVFTEMSLALAWAGEWKLA